MVSSANRVAAGGLSNASQSQHPSSELSVASSAQDHGSTAEQLSSTGPAWTQRMAKARPLPEIELSASSPQSTSRQVGTALARPPLYSLNVGSSSSTDTSTFGSSSSSLNVSGHVNVLTPQVGNPRLGYQPGPGTEAVATSSTPIWASFNRSSSSVASTKSLTHLQSPSSAFQKPSVKTVSSMDHNHSLGSRGMTAPASSAAPFLDHTVLHHGQKTLMPPENLGRRRQPDSTPRLVKTPYVHRSANAPSSTNIELKGQTSLANEKLDDKSLDVEKGKKVKKIKKEKKKGLDPEILSAVINVGRTTPTSSTSDTSTPETRISAPEVDAALARPTMPVYRQVDLTGHPPDSSSTVGLTTPIAPFNRQTSSNSLISLVSTSSSHGSAPPVAIVTQIKETPTIASFGATSETSRNQHDSEAARRSLRQAEAPSTAVNINSGMGRKLNSQYAQPRRNEVETGRSKISVATPPPVYLPNSTSESRSVARPLDSRLSQSPIDSCIIEETRSQTTPFAPTRGDIAALGSSSSERTRGGTSFDAIPVYVSNLLSSAASSASSYLPVPLALISSSTSSALNAMSSMTPEVVTGEGSTGRLLPSFTESGQPSLISPYYDDNETRIRVDDLPVLDMDRLRYSNEDSGSDDENNGVEGVGKTGQGENLESDIVEDARGGRKRQGPLLEGRGHRYIDNLYDRHLQTLIGAWEEDRCSGFWAVEERLERDLLRRKELIREDEDTERVQPKTTEPTELDLPANERETAITSTLPSGTRAIEIGQQVDSLRTMSSEVEKQMTVASDITTPGGLARELSISAPKRFAEAAERRIQLQRATEPSSKSSIEPAYSGASKLVTMPEEEQETEDALSFLVKSHVGSEQRAPKENEDDALTHDEESEDDEVALARPITTDAYRRFAEAAEKRILAEKALRGQQLPLPSASAAPISGMSAPISGMSSTEKWKLESLDESAAQSSPTQSISNKMCIVSPSGQRTLGTDDFHNQNDGLPSSNQNTDVTSSKVASQIGECSTSAINKAPSPPARPSSAAVMSSRTTSRAERRRGGSYEGLFGKGREIYSKTTGTESAVNNSVGHDSFSYSTQRAPQQLEEDIQPTSTSSSSRYTARGSRRPPPPPPEAAPKCLTCAPVSAHTASQDALDSLSSSALISQTAAVGPHSGTVNSSSQGSRPRKPLPEPPASTDRMDAFTALRQRERALAALEGYRPLHTDSDVSSPFGREVAISLAGTELGDTPNSAPTHSSTWTDTSPTLATNVSLEVPIPTPEPADSSIIASEFSAYTDLDLLLAQLDRRGEGGANYDELLLVGEVLGPARSPASSAQDIESLDVARVELERRRIDKQGKVKQKLSVVGVRCIECGICLTRFRVDDFAVVLPRCLHVFHAKCLHRWLLQSQCCPMCRVYAFQKVEESENAGEAPSSTIVSGHENNTPQQV